MNSGSPEPSQEQRLFDVHGAARYFTLLGAPVSAFFIRSLIADGAIPHLKIGRKFFVTREAIHTWITRHERRAR